MILKLDKINAILGGLLGAGQASAPFNGTPANVLVSNGNVAGTVVTAGTNVFVIANLTNDLLPPAPGYDAYFDSAAAGKAMIKCIAPTTQSYRIDFSGTVVAANPATVDGALVVNIESSLGLGNVFTGGTKPYPLGPGRGPTPSSTGISVTVYGSIQNGEVLFFRLSSNRADTLTLTDLIVIATVIKPAA